MARGCPPPAAGADWLETIAGVSRAGWRELLNDLGYAIEPLRPAGYLAKAAGHPAIVVHPHANAFLFARFDEQGRLPEGALIAACREHGAAYGLLAAGTRVRLLAAAPEEAGATTRYLELDAAALEPDMRPLLGLLSPRTSLRGRSVTSWAKLATTGRTCAAAWTSCSGRTCCPSSASSSAAGPAPPGATSPTTTCAPSWRRARCCSSSARCFCCTPRALGTCRWATRPTVRSP